MDKKILRDRLQVCFCRAEKSALSVAVRKFAEGELAVLQYIAEAGEAVNPSQISDYMTLSRSRVASILSSLRQKNYVDMEIDSADRRKMSVSITAEGKKFFKARRNELSKQIDRFIDALSAENAELFVGCLEQAVRAFEELQTEEKKS